MKSPRAPFLATLALVALACITPASLKAGETAAYTVNLTAPWKVGQTYGITTDASESMHTRLAMSAKPDAPLKDQTQKRAVHLEADAQALAVFAHGGLQQASFTVRSLRATLDGQPEREILPAGTKIVATSTGLAQKTYTVNGQPAAADVEPLLKLAISLDDPDHNDQMIFGPKKTVAVGETWQPDLAVIRQTLGKEFNTSATTTGLMKLEAVHGLGSDQVADISGTVSMTGLQPPLPPQFTTKEGSFKVVLGGSIPATRHGVRKETLASNMHFVSEAAGPDGGTMAIMIDGLNKSATVLVFP